jgi:light-regulated signal transduction histidine kinase (bacteriophytochrome)
VELDLRAERLEASRATLRRIVEDSPNVILIIDLAGSVRFVNRAATRLFGLAEPDLVERLGSFAIPCDASEIEIERQDGTSRTTEVRSVEIEWEGAQASLITLHDVTEHKQLQKQVEAENALLEQSVQERTEKLLAANAELETFARSVSHDLRAPVRHIKGFAEMLVEEAGGALSDSAQEFLQRIIRSADRMQMLIDDLLGFSLQARGTLCWERVSLGPLLSDVIEELAPEAAHRTVEWQIGDLPAVHADPSLLRLVLMNLLSNALKFTRTRDPARIEVFAVSGPPEPVIAVRDNGAGFDPRQAGRLFGAFQRLHSQAEFEGTGIGLATVRRIVTRHGGRVWAEGRPCEGATFFFTIGITP